MRLRGAVPSPHRSHENIRLGGRGERGAFGGEDHGQKPDRLGRAGASGHGVDAARRLIKHLPCRNGPLRLAIHLEAQITIKHVTQDEAGMLVTVRTGTGRR